MRARYRLLNTTVLAATLLELAACAPDRTTAPEKRLGAPIRVSKDVLAEQRLFDQPPLQFASLFLGGVSGDAAAVDFVVPSGGNWRLSRVVVVGVGVAPAIGSLFQINLFKDNGSGQPGDIVISGVSSLPAGIPNPCCGGQVFDYGTVMNNLEIPPGRYWLTNRLASGSLRTFSPQFAQRIGYPAMIGQPSLTPWTPVLADAPNNDFAFSIYGTVETAAEAAGNLLTTIEGFGLPAGTFTSLQAKLNAAQAALDAGDTDAACRAFQDLINATSAQSGKKLTEAQAKAIIDEATRIRLIIGC